MNLNLPAFLTLKQKTDYQENGYLVLPHFVEEAFCDALRQQAAHLVQKHAFQKAQEILSALQNGTSQEEYYLKRQSLLCFFFNEKALKEYNNFYDRAVTKISHALHDMDPVFDQFSRQTLIASVLSDLGVSQPLLIQSMYIFKHAFSGGTVDWHQDGTFIYTEPDTTIGLWFALEDATVENGCLWVNPKGHRDPLKYRLVVNHAEGMQFHVFDSTPWNIQDKVPLEVKKGTLILLHSRIPHMSAPNYSSRSRHAYTLHVVDKTSHYSAENWLQRSSDFPFRGFELNDRDR
jgi:phytanoyl-CoA hydroxylase